MKKAVLLKLLCIVIAAFLVLFLFAACTDSKEDEEKETTTVLGDDTSEDTGPSNVDENGYILDTVPTDTLNYDRTVTLLYWSDVEHEEFVSEKQTGEPVNDAIFLRNMAVEDRLGIDLGFISTPANSSNVANWVTFVRTDIESGTRSFPQFLLQQFQGSEGRLFVHVLHCNEKGILRSPERKAAKPRGQGSMDPERFTECSGAFAGFCSFPEQHRVLGKRLWRK